MTQIPRFIIACAKSLKRKSHYFFPCTGYADAAFAAEEVGENLVIHGDLESLEAGSSLSGGNEGDISAEAEKRFVYYDAVPNQNDITLTRTNPK